MDSSLALASPPHSPPASAAAEIPPNEANITAQNGNTDDEWANQSAGGSAWGYTSRWDDGYTGWLATDHLTRSTVLRAIRSDFEAANLTAVGTDVRNTSLDHLENRAWSSIQAYRSSEQGRKEGAPFPTFTLPQVEERFRQVQVAIRSRLAQKEVLGGEIEVMAQVLAEKKKRAKEIEDELSYSKSKIETNGRPKYRELATLATNGRAKYRAWHDGKQAEALWVSLLQSMQVRGLKILFLALPLKARLLNLSSHRNSEPESDTRKEIKKQGVLKRESAWLNVELWIPKGNAIDKNPMRNSTEKGIAKNDDIVKIVVDLYMGP
ncbi:hypothetical protein FB446DRAFT_708363 [Lentinula raphanica]|nr:hypothetical protein FB446DRAFT_708363 [Lentinula raphanica]